MSDPSAPPLPASPPAPPAALTSPPLDRAGDDPVEHLVLVPGLMCDAAVWAPQCAALAGRLTTQVVDPGDADDLGQMALALLQQAPRRFALAGHSMGGRVALEVMRRAPQRVQRLALLSTGYQQLAAGAAGERERAGRSRLQALAHGQGVAAMAREWVQAMVHPGRLLDAALMDTIVQMLARHPAERFDAQVRALLGRPDAGAVLATIRCPTLLLCGQADGWSPPDRHADMAARVPGSRLVLVPQAGHMVTLEQPEQVSAALLAWLVG